MEAKRSDLKSHTAAINAVLTEACSAPNSGPLVWEDNLVIKMIDSAPLSRRVTTDLGGGEFAVRLPIPDADKPRFWISLHEAWGYKNKRIIRFDNCGLRLYTGLRDEEAVQVMRLEWVAPTTNPDGVLVYDGKHAGHPHWHIDRSALIGPEDYFDSLEALTAAEPQYELQDFSESTARPLRRPVRDCSWLWRMHLPAQAGWMNAEWTDNKIPGPHQSEPSDITALGRWWVGSLRYLISELPKVAPYLS
jgi:hypothetical protein